jgi:hypothetical protein
MKSLKTLKCTKIKGFRGLSPGNGGDAEALSGFFNIYFMHQNSQKARL